VILCLLFDDRPDNVLDRVRPVLREEDDNEAAGQDDDTRQLHALKFGAVEHHVNH
jgi:hypothetical protein